MIVHDCVPGSLSTDPRPIARFRGACGCGCPELFLDYSADESRRVVLTDDFGQRVQMSLDQLSVLVAELRGGALDHLVG